MFTNWHMLHFAMANTDQVAEQNSDNKVQIAARVDGDVAAAIDHFKHEEGRTTSNMIERLLKTHPRVKKLIEAETAGVAA